MATWLACGPIGTVAWSMVSTAAGSSASTMLPSAVTPTGSSSCTVSYSLKFCGEPCCTSIIVTTSDSGMSTNSTARVTSTQKFPRPGFPSLTMPRNSANKTPKPTAGVTKFCTVRPIAWEK